MTSSDPKFETSLYWFHPHDNILELENVLHHVHILPCMGVIKLQSQNRQ